MIFLFGGLFILAFIIFLIFDIIRLTKFKKKFDFVTIIFFIVFILSDSLILYAANEKFWKKKELVGKVESENMEIGRLILYRNGTFDAKTLYIEAQCTYGGEYTLKNKILTLNRNDLEEKTEKTFTTEYKLDLEDSVLIPKDSLFLKIKIE